MSIEEELAEARADYALIEKRCCYYRTAYNELRVAQQEWPARVTAVRREERQARLLVEAQLRARVEEVAALKTQCIAQQKDLAAFELFKQQLAAKDALITQQIEELERGRKQLEALRTFNAQLLQEMRRLNAQLAAEDSLDEAAQQVIKLSKELEEARWKHGIYDAALKVLQDRVIEVERKNK